MLFECCANFLTCDKMKPKKTAEELVQMLHDEKGIQFHLISEEQAVECFSQRNNYLRTASYRKNYPKHIAGPNESVILVLEESRT